MKKLILFILISLSITQLQAKCAWRGLYAFPKGNTIKANSMIVIEGYGGSQKIIEELNDKNPVYLVNGNEKISLKIKETCVGQFHLTQAILFPEKSLKVGVKYTLVIENLEKESGLTRWNSEKKKHESIVYTVEEGVDTEKPVFNSLPKEIDKSMIYYGCGPAVYVNFKCDVKESSEYLVKTTVKSLTSGSITTYYVEPGKDKISIGHGMCSGEFNFIDGEEYEIEFTLVDASGNETPWTGDRIKFTRPK
jgi:hypothetical protein